MSDLPQILTKDIFQKWLSKEVNIHFTPDDIRTAQIVEVKALTENKDSPRIPFSLTLLSSMTEAYYQQGTFKVVLPGEEELFLFMVPIGVDSETGRMRYEVIFN